MTGEIRSTPIKTSPSNTLSIVNPE